MQDFISQLKAPLQPVEVFLIGILVFAGILCFIIMQSDKKQDNSLIDSLDPKKVAKLRDLLEEIDKLSVEIGLK